MSRTPEQAKKPIDFIRDHILADPEIVLEDPVVMKALLDANEQSLGGNIVDLRGLAMERLEDRLDRLEDTHSTVIAAAYDNLAGTNLIHKAVLKLLEPADFSSFLRSLEGDLKQELGVYAIRLVLETREHGDAQLGFDRVLEMVAPDTVLDLTTPGRDAVIRTATLRQVAPASKLVYGLDASEIRSEALLKLDLGPGRLPGLLVLGSEDPHQFRPNQGTDLLMFFAGAFERVLRRWLG